MGAEHNDDQGPPWFTDGKNLLILVLAVVALVQGFLLFRQSPPPVLQAGVRQQQEAAAPVANTQLAMASQESGVDQATQADAAPAPEKGDVAAAVGPEPSAGTEEDNAVAPAKVPVRVVAVTLESGKRRYVLISFDQPVGEGAVGSIPEQAPASFNPEHYGTWSWISPFTLRYDFAEPLAAGGETGLSLEAQNFLPQSYVLEGDTYFLLRTDVFRVDNWKIEESFAPEDPGKVVLSGEMEFSYEVDPGVLLQHLRLIDPLRGDNAPVPLRMETTYRTRWMEFRSEPLVKQEQPRVLQMSLEPGMTDAAGDLTISERLTRNYELQLNPDLRVDKALGQSAMDQSSVVVTFSAPVDPKTAGSFVQVSPEADFSLAGSGRDLVLSGAFKPGREYLIRVEKGLAAADGAILRQDWQEKLFIPDLQPSVAFEDPGMFLPARGRKNLAVKSVNLRKAKMFVDRVYVNNIFPLLQEYSLGAFFNDTGYDYGLQHYLGDRIIEKELSLPASKNEVQHTTLDVEHLVRGKGPGFYRLFLGVPDAWDGAQRWVLITDLGLVAKKGEDDVMVWVNSFASLEPAAGVELTVLSDQNQVIAQGRSDDQGLWHATGLAETFEEHKPFMVVAQKGEDCSFLLFDQFKIDPSGQDIGGERLSDKGYTAFVYGERDIYRPGETLKGVALLRRTDLQTPQSMPLTFLQKDPQGNEISKRVVSTDEHGTAAFAYDIAAYALTGNYSLEVLAADTVIATYRYKVEEFMPDRIKVEIAPEKAVFAPGEELRYTVDSRYFFGPPASELAVESKVILMGAPFAPAGYDSFQFGNPEGEFENKELTAGKPDDRLDAQGVKTFVVSLPERLTPPASLQAMLFARVSERGGRGVGAMQAVTVHPYPRYPGLKKLEDRGVDPGNAVSVDYVVLTPQEKEESGAALRVDFYKDRWQTVLRATPSGGYRYDSVRDAMLVSSTRLENAPARGSVTVTPKDFGSYRVVLTDEAGGARTQVGFYAGGWGYSPWAIENPARLEIVADKDEYAPGEEATLQLRTPFAGKLLLTVENNGVRDSRVLTLKEGENTATVTMPMRLEYAPNAYVTGVLVRSAEGLASGEPARAFGAVPVNVDRTVNRLDVGISTPQEIRPESALEISVRTEPGAVVTLAAVDEGILQLIAQKTPDPFARFYAKRALGTESYDIYSMLFPDVPPAVGTAIAGGDMGIDRLRQFVRSEGLRRVKPVAFWFGPAIADAQGKASFSVDVPAFQGALRVMAVVSDGRRFGSNHAVTRVRSPLVLTSTLPRFLSPGDTVQIPVTLRNDTDKEGAFTLNMRIEGAASAQVAQTVMQVPKAKEALAYFTVSVGQEPDALRFSFTAQGNGEQAVDSVEVPVRPALPARTVVQSGAVEKNALDVPFGGRYFEKQGLEREVYVGALPLLRFSCGLKDLLGYPYGCLEQTTSKVFPLLYYDALAAALSPEDLDGRQPAAMVQSGINRLLTMQLPDGDFTMWPGGDQPFPWGGLYASHFLLEARDAGFHVPDSVVQRALDAVQEQLRWKKEPRKSDLERMAYAHFVLAKAGRADRGGMDYMRKHFIGVLPPEGAALLAGAYGLLGDMKTMDKVLAAPCASASEQRETGDNLASPLRSAALRLAVLLEIDPDSGDVPRLVQQLTGLMKATPLRSTQENGLCYVALGRFFAKQERKAPFSGTLYQGERIIGVFTSEKTLHKAEITGDEPLRIVMDTGYEPGSAFYSVMTRGVPTVASYQPAAQGLAVEQVYLARDGKSLPQEGVAQGDLVVLRTRVKSLRTPVANVVLQALLPAGLEVENPRLENTERLPWASAMGDTPQYQDLRDDRVLLFLDLPAPSSKPGEGDRETWQTYYSLLRAVTPGAFAAPPVQAEAMYDPALFASGTSGSLTVSPDAPDAVVRENVTDAPQGASNTGAAAPASLATNAAAAKDNPGGSASVTQ